MKNGLKCLILLPFFHSVAPEPLFLRDEAHLVRLFSSNYSPFSPSLQPQIRLSGRIRPNQGGQKRPV